MIVSLQPIECMRIDTIGMPLPRTPRHAAHGHGRHGSLTPLSGAAHEHYTSTAVQAEALRYGLQTSLANVNWRQG